MYIESVAFRNPPKTWRQYDGAGAVVLIAPLLKWSSFCWACPPQRYLTNRTAVSPWPRIETLRLWFEGNTKLKAMRLRSTAHLNPSQLNQDHRKRMNEGNIYVNDGMSLEPATCGLLSDGPTPIPGPKSWPDPKFTHFYISRHLQAQRVGVTSGRNGLLHIRYW